MQFDRLANEIQCLFASLPYRHTTREIRDIRSEGRFTLLKDYDVFHVWWHLWLFKTSSFPDTGESSYWNIYTCFPSNGHGSWLIGMSKLPMTTFVRTRRQPSASSVAITSLTFTVEEEDPSGVVMSTP